MKKILQLFVLVLIQQSFSQTILESYPGSTPSIFQTSNYINMNGKMYYFGRTSGYQWSLYSTDGTTTGNTVVKNLGLQLANVIPQDIDTRYNDWKAVYNNKLYFTAIGQLWQSDGTTAGTIILNSYNYLNAKYFKIFNNKLYFTAQNGTNGTEVWSTDGTVAGTTMLKDIYPGANPSIDQQFDPHFTVFNNKLFFVANDGTNGFELWSTDGTTAGTNLFKNLLIAESETAVYNQGAFKYVSNYSTVVFKVCNNKMYFMAKSDFTVQNGGGGTFVLFETDGTDVGTKNVAVSIPSGQVDLTNFVKGVTGLTVDGTNLIISGGTYAVSPFPGGGTVSDFGIFKVDSANLVSKISNINFYRGDLGNGPDTEQGSMKLYNGEYYFIAGTPELYKINLVTNQVTQVSQPASLSYVLFNTNNGYSRYLVSQVWNGKLYFVKADGTNGAIYATDGTLAGTTEVSKGAVNQQATSSILTTLKASPTHFGAFANGLYFGGSYTGGVPASLQRFYDSSLLSTQKNSLSKFFIYPNPASSQINLSFENNIENANIKIISLLGQTVLEKQNLSDNDMSLDVSILTNGMYVIEVKEGNTIKNSKFIKE